MKKIEYPITALDRGGNTVLLYNIEEARAFDATHKVGDEWSYWGQYYRDQRRIPPYYWSAIDPIIVDWIFRDDFGQPVNPADIRRPFVMRKWHRKGVVEAAAKGLPIPGSGKRKYRRSRWTSNAYRNNAETVKSNAAFNDFEL